MWNTSNASRDFSIERLNLRSQLDPITEIKSHKCALTGTGGWLVCVMQVEQGGALPWSPLSICSQYARLRGFVRNDHPDVIKAGMTILRRVLDMRLPYSVPAPAAPTEDAVGVVANGEGA